MLYNLSLLSLLFLFRPVYSFYGAIGKTHVMRNIPNHIAYGMLKIEEINSISKNVPAPILDEIHDAREMCRSSEGIRVAMLYNLTEKAPDYTILYRTCEKLSYTVYTVEAMLINRDKNEIFSMSNVNDILKDFCQEHMSYLQIHPLKHWATGRYHRGILLERSLEVS